MRSKFKNHGVVKRAVSVLLSVLLCACLHPFEVSAEPTVSAKAAVVLNGVTREVIWSKNGDEKLTMASTTKIMTSLLLIESGKLDETVTVTADALVEGSSVGLRAGNTVTGRTLLAGMLLESGNDAATASAIAVSGSVEKFAELMNRRAAEIGMTNSHFVTPSGLDAEGHYSTAYDMALLTAEALLKKDFRETCSAEKAQVSYSSPDSTHTFTNHNKLLDSYDGCIGVKTGYTKKSGRCLISAARRNGKLIIAVTLSDPDDWNDHKKLLDYGMSKTESVDVTYHSPDMTISVVGSDVSLAELAVPECLLGLSAEEAKKVTSTANVVPFVYAPARAGQKVGTVDYYYNGWLIKTDNVYVGGSVGYSEREMTEGQRLIRSFRLLLSFYK